MDPSEAIVEALIKKGWSFRDPQEIKSLIRGEDHSPESAESELLNMDLRSIGAKSLPDPSVLKKSSHISGPKILQVVSLRDISQSSIDASFKNSQRRLLRFVLTDGQSEVKAIEYVSIPFITEEISPGTKIRLENNVPVHSGILCLNPKVVTVLGGVVPSLYEEWQMSQKYSGFSRSSLRLSQKENGVGPPQFEKLQIEAFAQRQGTHGVHESTSKYAYHRNDQRQVERDMVRPVGNKALCSNDPKADKATDCPQMISSIEKTEEKPSTSDVRPKEVSEAVPVQNQAAAQKLLQKMSQPSQMERNPRGPKHRFKGKQEETEVLTLDEWEKRKGNKPLTGSRKQDISRDEELAWQLQNQLDLEDFHGRTKNSEAEQIRMSMFSFGGPEESRDGDRREFRGRGRGRGRGRRGRGRFS